MKFHLSTNSNREDHLNGLSAVVDIPSIEGPAGDSTEYVKGKLTALFEDIWSGGPVMCVCDADFDL